MASASLMSLQTALSEVVLLQALIPGFSGPAKAPVTRSLSRATVVLLSSHFERYVYAVTVEAVDHLNGVAGLRGVDVPEGLRLIHSRESLKSVETAAWDNRRRGLEDFVASDGWLWSGQLSGRLASEPLLAWMKAPTPKNLRRYFRYWLINDIFAAVTRSPGTKSELIRQLGALVDKRNAIAHGDVSEQATRQDLVRYRRAVEEFCRRTDAVLGRKVTRIAGGSPPW